jgi:hypothetical protein
MEGFASPALEGPRSVRRFNHVRLVLFRNCREPKDFPMLLAENMADQIVLVQPLHDRNDASPPLVV